jgi:hypothetical protein
MGIAVHTTGATSNLTSEEHFSVNGTLIDAWTLFESLIMLIFKLKDTV